MEKLFSYGTLQMPQVQTDTFGRLLDGKKDTLIGYQLAEVTITDQAVIQSSGTNIHPILKHTGNPDDHVEGTVFEVSKDELAQADEYEVDDYQRVRASFLSGQTAWAYVCAQTS